MRQGRRVRWILGALGGLAVIAATTGSSRSQCDCGNGRSRSFGPTTHDLTVHVQNASRSPVMGAVVTAWVIDLDRPGEERVPIVVGTATTDGDGIVQFSFTSSYPPYVCGYSIVDAEFETILAEQAPDVAHQLSMPSGLVTVVLP